MQGYLLADKLAANRVKCLYRAWVPFYYPNFLGQVHQLLRINL